MLVDGVRRLVELNKIDAGSDEGFQLGVDDFGKPGGDGFIYVSAADTAATWRRALHCEAGPDDWETEASIRAGLSCSAYGDCAVGGHEVVSCMDPDGKHEWPEQGFGSAPATCVTPEQYDSLPDHARCGPATGAYEHLGMDLIWDFVSRYRRPEPTE